MPTSDSLSTAQQILQVLQHLGLTQVHVAVRLATDWQDLALHHAQHLASVTLVCPRGLDPGALAPVAHRLGVIAGAHGRPGETLRRVLGGYPDATFTTLPGYDHPTPYADIAADCPEALSTAMLAFLAQRQRQQPVAAVRLAEVTGDVGDIMYRVRGAGPPLVLFPLSAAPSQWEPIMPQLTPQYCVITLSGAALGMVASLEGRGHTAGYLRVVGNVLDAARIQPGEVILEVGSGTGVLDRWMVRRTAGANKIVGVDVNRFFLHEAATLARKEGVGHLIEFREGSAEALPFPDATFDVALASTVIQRADADRMLAEMTRVTKPGGRVAIVGHAHDMPQWVNLPLPAALKARIEAPGWHDAEPYPTGCDEASLYPRMRRAGVTALHMFPQFAAFDERSRLEQMQASLLPTLSPEDTHAWLAAVAHATAAGTFFVATPFHCAVGVKAATAA